MPSLRENPGHQGIFYRMRYSRTTSLALSYHTRYQLYIRINRFAQTTSVRQMAPNHRLSFPEGKSVNDSIYQNSVAMYITVESSQRV